jgi:outer membrane murein-binding lipoprotein Lpp
LPLTPPNRPEQEENEVKKAKLGLLVSVSLVAALMLGGCATTKEVEKLRADVQQASSAANSAQQTADAAMKEAAAARAAAERAEKAAMDAKAASEATEAKIDNMFKKSMQKG